MPPLFNRQILSWACYDWANSAFATVVMAGFFPLFFKQYWSSDVPATESTFHLSVANSLAGLLIVLLAPVLGAIADAGGLRKRLLFVFSAFGVLMTAALYGMFVQLYDLVCSYFQITVRSWKHLFRVCA